MLSLSLIVRDAAHTITPCLQSIRPWVDEMIVVDTGSVDGTAEIAESLGAKVFHFPWCDDFAAARNESLKYASGEWIFWMDADDVIDEENGRKLRAIVAQEVLAEVLGFVLQVRCPMTMRPDGPVTVVDPIKLVRNRPELRFEGRIHEQILPSIRRAGGEVAWTDVCVVHAGADLSTSTAQMMRRKSPCSPNRMTVEPPARPTARRLAPQPSRRLSGVATSSERPAATSE